MGVFPLNSVKPYLENMDYEHIYNDSDTVPISNEDRRSSFRRGRIIIFLEEKGKLSDFITKHWPEGSTREGLNNINTCKNWYYKNINNSSLKQISKNSTPIIKIDKNEFYKYLKSKYPNSAENTILRIKSDAFFINNNQNIGINFQGILSGIIEPDDIYKKLKKHLEYRKNPHACAYEYIKDIKDLVNYFEKRSGRPEKFRIERAEAKKLKLTKTLKPQKLDDVTEKDKFEIINKSFRKMLPPLAQYIGISLIENDKVNWWKRFVLNKLSESTASNLPQNGNFDDCVNSLDIQACLVIIINNWKDIFQKKLNNNNHLNWAHELKTLRNEIDAHYTSRTLDTFSEKDLKRGIDTMVLFMDPINKDVSKEIYFFK